MILLINYIFIFSNLPNGSESPIISTKINTDACRIKSTLKNPNFARSPVNLLSRYDHNNEQISQLPQFEALKHHQQYIAGKISAKRKVDLRNLK